MDTQAVQDEVLAVRQRRVHVPGAELGHEPRDAEPDPPDADRHPGERANALLDARGDAVVREAEHDEEAREQDRGGGDRDDAAHAGQAERRCEAGFGHQISSKDETVKVTSSRSSFCSDRVRMRRLFTERSCGADSIPCRKETACASVTCFSTTWTFVSL